VSWAIDAPVPNTIAEKAIAASVRRMNRKPLLTGIRNNGLFSKERSFKESGLSHAAREGTSKLYVEIGGGETRIQAQPRK
jgi:hypothetical protein